MILIDRYSKRCPKRGMCAPTLVNGYESYGYCGGCCGWLNLWISTAVSGKGCGMIDQAPTLHASRGEAIPVEPPALLLSKTDLARELRVSAKTIDRMDQSGRLPRPIRVGSRAKRWPREIIVAWVAAGAPNRRDFERMGR
jgi:predicted DNA-binding transcriptional regulator AlpA